MSAMALNLKRMAKAIFSAIYMDKMWAENMISQPIFHLCQRVHSLTLPNKGANEETIVGNEAAMQSSWTTENRCYFWRLHETNQ